MTKPRKTDRASPILINPSAPDITFVRLRMVAFHRWMVINPVLVEMHKHTPSQACALFTVDGLFLVTWIQNEESDCYPTSDKNLAFALYNDLILEKFSDTSPPYVKKSKRAA